MRRQNGLRVLITNFMLDRWAGTELFVRDLSRGLLDAGHQPVVYSPRPGKLAEEIRKQTVPVVDDLVKLTATPDIIHGQHVNETLSALLHFPDTPALFFCHDWYFNEDVPPRFPRLLRYVAIDYQCYDKLVCERAVPEDRASILSQFVDLERFRPRSVLPERPRRAAVLCNYTKENEYLREARDACARAGVSLDVYGLGVGNPCHRPEEVLRDYDVVFAKGRAALEALAVGAAVVIYWWRRLGPMVKSDDLEMLRADGFGVRAMGPQLTPFEFGQQIERAISSYDPLNAAEVTRRVRESTGSDDAIGELVKLYEEVIAEHAAGPPPDRVLEARAAAAHLREMSLACGKQREVIYSSTPFRVTERLLRTPVLGKVSRFFARGLSGRRES
jgi:hypothetical protein